MASTLHLTGPVTVKLGSSTVGQTDGEILIDITRRRNLIPITTDASGGAPATVIQGGEWAQVRIRLQQFDRAIGYQLERRITAAGGVASFSNGQHIAGAVGKDLSVADPGDLVLEGTDNKYTFGEPFPDPEGEFGLQGIGWKAHYYVLSLICLPASGTGLIDTYAAS